MKRGIIVVVIGEQFATSLFSLDIQYEEIFLVLMFPFPIYSLLCWNVTFSFGMRVL